MTRTESLDLDTRSARRGGAAPAGTVRYRERGAGPTVLFVHGLLVNGALWRKVVPELAPDFRCIVPDWPLGSHEVPLGDAADRTAGGMAQLIADFMAALELEDVTLVGNDSGGALSQLVVTRHPERVGRLVLTPCDAFDNFPPKMFRYLSWAAKAPGAMAPIAQSMRLRANRRTPIAFGWLTKRRLPNAVLGPLRRSDHPRPPDPRGHAGVHPRYRSAPTPSRPRRSCASLTAPCCWRGRPRTASSRSRTPSGSPTCCPTPGSSGSRTRARSCPRISRFAWPS